MFNDEGVPVGIPKVPTRQAIEATLTPVATVAPRDADVRYSFETMYHIGSGVSTVVAGVNLMRYTGHDLQAHWNAAGNATYYTRGNATEYENRLAIKGRFSFRVTVGLPEPETF